MNAVHFSSATIEWETPQDLFDKLNETHFFTLDVCATPENAKRANYFTKEVDGLKQEWEGVCWMNPPYGREIGKWVKKGLSIVAQRYNRCGVTSSKDRHQMVP